MPKPHTIDDLRAHLFATLDGLTNEEKPMDIERAKAVAEVAQVVINTAKVEVEHARITGSNGSGFLCKPGAEPRSLPDGTTVEEKPGVRVVTHRMRG